MASNPVDASIQAGDTANAGRHALSATQSATSGTGSAISAKSANSSAPALLVQAAGPLIHGRTDAGVTRFKVDNNGMLTGGSQANFPVISAGRWHTDGQGTAAQGPTIVASRGYAVPLWPGRACTLTAVSMNIGAAFSTPGTIRGGLFLADGTSWLPAALLSDAGTFAEATGTKSWSGLTLALEPTLYFWVVTAQGGTSGTPTWSSRNSSHPLITDGAATPNPNTNRTAYYTDTGFSAGYPATYPAPDGIVVGPSLSFKLT